MLSFYLCTLVKRVAWVNSKFALKLQAAPVCPGSVGRVIFRLIFAVNVEA